jgi:hypothetical protein
VKALAGMAQAPIFGCQGSIITKTFGYGSFRASRLSSGMTAGGWIGERLVSVQIARRESGIAVFNVAAHSAFNT